MKGQSEPPDRIDINIRTGLKKGFPIKISGYAVGGENNPVNICDNNQRFRSRRNSESSLERPKRGSTPDPAKSEEISVKQLYSPLLGIRDRDRNGFRRRSIGGFSNRSTGGGPQNSDRISVIRNFRLNQAFHQSKENLQAERNEQQTFSNILEDKIEQNFKNEINFNRPPPNDLPCKKEQSSIECKNFQLKIEDSLESNSSKAKDQGSTAKTGEFDIGKAINEVSEELKIFQKVNNNKENNLCELQLQDEIIENHSDGLDDVITKMKNSLKAIKDGMSVKALTDINREYTPLELPPLTPLRELTPADLPALSPLPPYLINRNNFLQDDKNIIIVPQQLENDKILPAHSPSLFQNFDNEETTRNPCEDNRDDREDTVTASDEAEDDIITHRDAGQGQFARQNEEVESHVSVTVYIDTSGTTGELVDNLDNVEHDGDKSTNNDNIFNNAKDEGDDETDDSDSNTDECDSTEDNEFMTDASSNCSTPTLTTIIQNGYESDLTRDGYESDMTRDGYESDVTVYPDTDCEDIYGDPTKLKKGQVCHLSDTEQEEVEDYNDAVVTIVDTDTKKSNTCHKLPITHPRRHSYSQEQTQNKSTQKYCWQCYQVGHDQWTCGDSNQSQVSETWCPRCLETTHWEDDCWVLSQQILCSVCSVPGHLAIVHSTEDFAQRKLVIDTFGWLSFKSWFQDVKFRSWWNCNGFTGVPLYKIMMRNNSHIL